MVDFYKVMDCQGPIVTKENIAAIKLQENLLLYPPRIKVLFRSTDKFISHKTVVVHFEGVKSSSGSLPVTCTITLNSGMLLLTTCK